MRPRIRKFLRTVPAATVLAFAAACGSSGSPAAAPASGTAAPVANPSTASSAGGASSAAAGSALEVTASQSLGQIVTTGTGLTVYRYDADSDDPPKSACSGGCATAWPPVLYTGSGTPAVSGVSASLVGVLTRADGSKQLTLDGWPLYTYAGDKAPGSTAGQGVGGSWWAVTPAGAKAAGSAAGASGTASSGGAGGW